MPGVNGQPHFMGQVSRQRELLELRLFLVLAFRLGVGRRAQLDGVRAEAFGPADADGVGGNKEADLDAGRLQPRHGFVETRGGVKIQAALGRDLARLFRNDADGIGLGLQGQGDHLRVGGYLQMRLALKLAQSQ